jgi:hypothetical protein
MNPFALLAPLFLAFELWQLVVAERYMGIRQIRAQADPRELPMKESLAAFWSVGLIAYSVWMVTLLLHPLGRAQGVILLLTTAVGYSLRSTCGLKWVLVVLTFEGSIRVGMLISLVGMVWRQLTR